KAVRLWSASLGGTLRPGLPEQPPDRRWSLDHRLLEAKDFTTHPPWLIASCGKRPFAGLTVGESRRARAGDAGRRPRVCAEVPSLRTKHSSGRSAAREVDGGRTRPPLMGEN